MLILSPVRALGFESVSGCVCVCVQFECCPSVNLLPHTHLLLGVNESINVSVCLTNPSWQFWKLSTVFPHPLLMLIGIQDQTPSKEEANTFEISLYYSVTT